MTSIQPALDGTVPTPKIPAARRKAEDYETWIDEVWPKYLEAAASGRTYTIFEIADQHQLAEPPDPAHHWGRLATLLREAGYHRPAGWTTSSRPSSHHSGLRTWKGTAAARRAAA
ncbi:hypothetical protein AB0M92_18805 [Streptomyces sp. NPDC051582]|uniref:hypothetical protein n=1 Tax=Streptomyces sp. NPDC051582 TaxID=3155167 RepID=UPI00342C411F